MSHASRLELAYNRHPTLQKPLAEIVDFLDARGWGSITLEIRNGRVVHLWKTQGTPITEATASQGENRSEAANGKER